MKVLQVFKTYLPHNFGGIERVIWGIAEGTAPFGVENHVLSLSDDNQGLGLPVLLGSHYSHKAKLDLYVASTGLSYAAIGKFRVLAADADIIHYHFPWPMMDVMHFIAQSPKPTVLTYHSDVVRQRLLKIAYTPLMHLFLRSVDHIVATSPNYAATSRVLQKYLQKTSVIPIGLPERTLSKETNIAEWRARVGEDFFLFIGEFRYYKGLQYLLDAARLTGLPVVVAGRGDLDREQVPANVKIVGSVSESDKEALLTLCCAFVFPSHLRSEAFGVALVEAARAGRPMISCEIGTGTSFVNLHEVTGLVVPPGNGAALAAAMQRIAADESLENRFGMAARRRYETVFTAFDMSRAYVDLYETLGR